MLKRKAKIGIISLEDPTDRNISSGTNYKIVETLRREGADIIWLHPYHSWLWIFLEGHFEISISSFHQRLLCSGIPVWEHS